MKKLPQDWPHKMDNPWFAWDNYRRFLQCYGMAFGLERDDFDAIIAEFKVRMGIPLKKGFTGEQMKMVALAYKSRIRDEGVENPYGRSAGTALHDHQRGVLFLGIPQWPENLPKNHGDFRRLGHRRDGSGSMVFGNISPQAGSGVFLHTIPDGPAIP